MRLDPQIRQCWEKSRARDRVFAGKLGILKGHSLQASDGAYPVLNCSDADYLCVTTEHVVYGVPRAGLTPTSVFTAGGARLRVEKCLLEKNGACARAMLSSECRWLLKQDDGCFDVPLDAGSDEFDVDVTYFIFDRERGITSLGDIVELEAVLRKQMSTAQYLRLRSPKGLLAEGALMPPVEATYPRPIK